MHNIKGSPLSIMPTREQLQQRINKLEIKIQSLSQSKKSMLDKHEQRLEFEKLLTELSMIFVKIPAEEVDEKVEAVLRQIGEMLGFDRVDFIQYVDGTKYLKFKHSWTVSGDNRFPPIIANNEYPWFIEETKTGKILHFNTHELPEEALIDRENMGKKGITSGLIIPSVINRTYYGTIFFGSHTRYRRSWIDEYSDRLKLIAEVIVNALIRQQAERELKNAFSEIKLLKDQLENENILLTEEIESIKQHKEIIGQSNGIKKVLKKAEQVAQTNSTVLILGETGTGKELVARAIHEMSRRNKLPMITVNCATLPANLIEGELFGREKGAYTGAVTRQVGRFEKAHGSSIFLDEIGELPLELQAKLLRVLQQGEFERLGSTKTVKIDVRVIAATNRDLEEEIQKGRFREDLFYRLNVYPIRIPALRERKSDIFQLVWAFVKEISTDMGKPIESISRNSLESIKNYTWPGNIRELRNIVERSMITCKGRVLTLEAPKSTKTRMVSKLTLDEHQKRYILKTLKETGWRIRGEKGTAELLGIKPTTLYSRMKKLGISRPG